MDNNLDPNEAPHVLVHGVRRLNHVPLLMICGVLIIVGGLIVMVAIDKNGTHSRVTADHGGPTDGIAQQIAGDHTGYTKAFHPPTPLPIETIVAPTSSPPDTGEVEARKKAFYQALFSSSTVEQPIVIQKPDAIHVEKADPVVEAPNVIIPPNMYAGPVPTPEPNKLSTYDGNKDRWKINTRLEPPPSKFTLRTGWVIPALMLSAMESELPGTITAQVSQDVFDTPTGKYLLIPQGSRIVGEYANTIAYGQSRIFVAWQRIIYPNGDALDIGAMPGVDGQGEAGFHDKVNNHFLTIFGSALLMSAITGGISLSQPQNNFSQAPNAGSTLSQALGQQLGAATSSLLEKNLSVPPTLQVRQGYAFNIVVVKDLVFEKPYVVPNY